MSQHPFTRQVIFGAGRPGHAFTSSSSAPVKPPLARDEVAARAPAADRRRLDPIEAAVRCLDRPRMARIATAVRGLRAGRRGSGG